MRMGDFKKLRVWQEACKFADRVEAMARQLPQPERGWAFDQLVPAAHAIHENLAEGWGFDSDPQRLKYCRQALSTGNESEDQLLNLERKDLLGLDFESLPAECRSVCAQLGALKIRIEQSVAKSRAKGQSLRSGKRRPPRSVKRPPARSVKRPPPPSVNRRPSPPATSDQPPPPATSDQPRPLAKSRKPKPADGHKPAPGPGGHTPSD